MRNIYLLILCFFVFSELFAQKTRGKRGINYTKEAKKLEKDGWRSGSMEALQFQIQAFYDIRNMRDDEGRRTNIFGVGFAEDNSKSVGYQAARDLAKADIAGKLETEIRAVTKIDQRSDPVANSLNDIVIVTTALVKQKITPEDIYIRERDTGRKNSMGKPVFEYEVGMFMNFENVAKLHMQLMRDEVNRNAAKEVRDEYEKFLKDGLYDEVRSNVDSTEEN